MTHKRKGPTRRRLPATRKSITHRVEITDMALGVTDVYIIVGEYPNGSPGEVFIKVGKEGSTLQGVFDAIGIQTSLLLQVGVPLPRIAEKMIGMKFVPEGKTDNPDIPQVQSIIDYIFRWLVREYGQD